MTDLYLIAHKVHGKPAFDIACQLECPECVSMGCSECDDLGYWWIIPTSGHRAYTYWHIELNDLLLDPDFTTTGAHIGPPAMPPDLPDHYPHAPHRTDPRISLADRLGLTTKPKASAQPFPRRI